MEALTRREMIEMLVASGNGSDLATLYADAFIEYRTASENIERNGIIVGHPRTGNPIPNPYLDVRDGAVKKLQRMRDVVGVDPLWMAERERQ